MNEPEPEDGLAHLLRRDSNLVDEVGTTLCGATLLVIRASRRAGADELRGEVLATDIAWQLPYEINDGCGEEEQPLGDVSAAPKARCPFQVPVACSLFCHSPPFGFLHSVDSVINETNSSSPAFCVADTAPSASANDRCLRRPLVPLRAAPAVWLVHPAVHRREELTS